MNTMTEDEATTKWCPLARLPYNGGSSVNREVAEADQGKAVANIPAVALCIGSACMAFRWTGSSKRTGYCGAFGKPEE